MTTISNTLPVVLVIVAAGSSQRMGGLKKEYLDCGDGTVLSSSALAFLKTYHFDTVVVVIPLGDEERARKAFFADKVVCQFLENTKLFFVFGGKTRQESVFNALEKIGHETLVQKSVVADDCIVLIHDGARPFVTSKIILDTIDSAAKFGAAVPGVQPVDTQKEIDENGIITRHLQRKNLVAVQTPQGFRFSQLFEAHKRAKTDGKEYTDDTEIWGNYCGAVRSVLGDVSNKKITYKSDILNISKDKGAMIRVGIGYDLHKLVENRPLILGGVQIPFEKGEEAHSDGDVLLHALTDALLGACGMGDIGSFFPPEDKQWKDVDSKFLLKTVWEKIKKAGWQLCNADCVIALEKPKFIPWREKVINSIAEVLEVSPTQIFVKAKTGEKMGKIGRSEAVEVIVTCLLEK